MILLIDNYDSFTYNLYQMIAQYDNTVQVVRNDKIDLDKIKQLQPQAIILSPGPGHPTEAGICIDIIKNFSGQIPILGVCLGHQAIVHAFGGKVIQANEIVHGKASPVFHQHQGIFAHMPMPFLAGRYHSLVAEPASFPAVLDVTAQTQSGMIMGLAHKQHLTFGVQFHPESILTPEGYDLISEFLKIAKVKSC
ncbi:MAG: aminodeoxychorismate/anthranilate synthase component II [Legionellales bacterium]|jgi:anthranilate synthase/aminodeoxychorismate synthase-like glutamine amidotransferase